MKLITREIEALFEAHPFGSQDIQGVTAEQQYQFIRKQPEIRYTYKINSTNVHFDIPKGAR